MTLTSKAKLPSKQSFCHFVFTFQSQPIMIIYSSYWYNSIKIYKLFLKVGIIQMYTFIPLPMYGWEARNSLHNSDTIHEGSSNIIQNRMMLL